ncbi:MAG TPA: sigma-70 family RNA polymerase sigma factor [Bryobacteraceae bacterium]|nr:sigma-70 family RNA polymerase sigma factor [Bryobacteraceae bacterium]
MERMKALALPPTADPAAEPNGEPDDCAGSAGNERATGLTGFEQLMRRHERLVLMTALRLMGNLEDAQDASQEVFLRLYRNRHKVETLANLPGWLYRVTVNVCHDLRRKRSDSAVFESAAELVAEGNPQRTALEAERRKALALSLRMLGEKERAALVLRDLEGLSTADVAETLGVTEATVRAHVSKARVKIREFVERYFRSQP